MDKVREGYKATEFGVIPKEWEIKEISELIDEGIIEDVMDGNHGESHPKASDYVEEGVPFIMANNLSNGKVDLINCKFISEQQSKLLRKGFSKAGDVLLTHKGTIGETAIVPEIAYDYIVLTPQVTYYRVNSRNDKLLNSYLKVFFDGEKFQTILKTASAQSTRDYIGITNQKKLNIILPKLSEQQKIADILSSVDEQIEITDALIEKTKELKKGLMQKLLTKGIGHTKFKMTEMGEIPEEWEVMKSRDVFHTVTDYVANGSFASLKENVNYKDKEDYAVLIRLTDYNNNFEGPFVYVDKKAYEFLSKSSLKAGDIIIANVGAYAGFPFRVKDINKPMTLGPNAILVRSNENNDYIYYWLQSKFGQESLKNIISTTAQPKFNKTDFRTLLMPIPQLKEQKHIASILYFVDVRIQQYELEKDKCQELKNGLMQNLLTGKLRVNAN